MKNRQPDLSNAAQKLDEIHIKINRLHSKKTALLTKNHRVKKTICRARTRTLIQAGGLLDVSGLLSLCNLETGNDLQGDPESFRPFNNEMHQGAYLGRAWT